MRWVVLLVILLLGLAGAAFALAGPSGGGAGAFALVNPNGGAPLLVADHTSGFSAVSVGPFGPGDYCLTASPGVNIDGTAAVASEEAFYSDAIGVATVRYRQAGQPALRASWR